MTTVASSEMKSPVKFSLTIGIILILSLLGSLMIYYATYWGPWAYSDSAGYIASARNLLAGHGLGYFSPSGDFMPLSIHPPFYPLVLSASGLVGVDIVVAARWLNIILFGLTIFLSGTFVYSVFHSSWFALSISATLLTLPTFVDVSSGAMSELLFLFTTILGICLLVLYLGSRKKYILFLSSLLIGLALLARINGVAIVSAGLIVLLLAIRISWKQRIFDALVFGFVSVTPLVLWLIWVYSQTGKLAARNYFFTLNIWSATAEFRRELMAVFWSWLPFQPLLPPYSYQLSRNIFLFLFIVIFILLGLISFKRRQVQESSPTPSRELSFALLWIIFVISNILLLAASFIFIDLVPNKDTRTFFYIQFGLAFAFLALIAALIKEFRLPPSLGWIFASLVLVFNISNAQTSWGIISQLHTIGNGYTSRAWQESQTLQALRELPANVPIITNQSAAVLLQLDRPAYDFCALPCDSTGKLRYGDDPSDPVQQVFREHAAALVFFYPACGVQNSSDYANQIAQLQSLTQNLTHYFSSCDGEIYFYPSSSPN